MTFQNLISKMDLALTQKYKDVKWTSFHSQKLEEGENRFDGSFYCDSDIQSKLIFEESSYKKVPLKEFLCYGDKWKKSIFLPNRSSRVYVRKNKGIPYFSGSDIVLFYPKPSAYLAPKHKTVVSTQIKKNWLLVAARGTIGSTIIVTERMHNASASDNIIRISTTEDNYFGFIYAFFLSRFGQYQFKKSTYGAVVDAISPNHISNIEIPCLNNSDIKTIHNSILEAFSFHDKANDLLDEADNLFYDLLCLPRISEEDIVYLKSSDKKVWEINEFGFENRIDATFYDLLAKKASDTILSSNLIVKNIGDKDIVKKVFMPGRFKRTYVGKGYGIPFLSGKNIIQITPGDLKYLAKRKQTEDCLIREGWVLLTRSGTIGRTALVTSDWDNWAATEHIIRIVPSMINPGYLITFINSDYGQLLISRFTHGSVVDEISVPQVEQVIIPIPDESIQSEIGEKAQKAYGLHAQANMIERKAIESLENKLKGIIN